jgi:hypothetical protein
MSIALISILLVILAVPCLVFTKYVQKMFSFNMFLHESSDEIKQPYAISAFTVRLLGATFLLLVSLVLLKHFGVV